MSNEDIKNVADVRRAVWTGGFAGLGSGLIFGYFFHRSMGPFHSLLENSSGHRGKKAASEMWRFARPGNKNHRFLFTLAFGALFSFVGASTAGTNNRYRMQDVYQRGSTSERTSYQRVREEAQGGYNSSKQDITAYQKLVNRETRRMVERRVTRRVERAEARERGDVSIQQQQQEEEEGEEEEKDASVFTKER